MLRHIDHTKDIEIRRFPLTVASTDYCRCFELRSHTIFKGKDCWHCKSVILEYTQKCRQRRGIANTKKIICTINEQKRFQ